MMSYEDTVVNISTAVTQATRYCTHANTDLVKRVQDVAYSYSVEPQKPKIKSASVNSVTRVDKHHKEGSDVHRIRRHCQSNTRSTRQLRRNERERGRKARLNAAFQVLKSVVPDNINAGSSDRKLTQVEILRLAKNYISKLTELLKQDNNYSFSVFNTE